MLFQVAEGHPVSREELRRLPITGMNGRAGLHEVFDVGSGGFDFLAAGVVLGVDRLQAGLGYVSVYLGSRQTTVAQQHLHGA